MGKSVKLTQKEINNFLIKWKFPFNRYLLSIPCPSFDLDYYCRVCDKLKIFDVYLVHLSKYEVKSFELPEIYAGITRQDPMLRVAAHYYKLQSAGQYEYRFGYKYCIIHENLNRDNAKIMERRVISALRRNKACAIKNIRSGGEVGGRSIEKEFFKDVLYKYYDNIRLESVLYCKTNNIRFPQRNLFKAHDIPEDPRFFRDIYSCIDETARDWESKSRLNNCYNKQVLSPVLTEIKSYLKCDPPEN